jgi:16S rRNA (guanine527-N7)-methyltransferase
LKDLWRWGKPLLRKSMELGVQSQESGSNSELTTSNPGLICLKGGDLASEIQESATRPRIMEIHDIFPEEYFREKYILYVPR